MSADSEDKFSLAISAILKVGVTVSLFLIVLGSVLIFVNNGSNGIPLDQLANVSSISGINSRDLPLSNVVTGAIHGSGLYIVALGLWVLVFTPISVVFASLMNFIFEKNRLYVVMSTIVLVNLFLALFIVS